MTIDPKYKAKVEKIDIEAMKMERNIMIQEMLLMRDDVAVIHAQHKIANLYYSLLKEILPQ